MRAAILAALWSAALFVIAVHLSADGHGLVEPSWVLASPFPAQWLGLVAIVLSVLFWSAAGWSATQGHRRLFPILLVIHYSIAVIQLAVSTRDDITDRYMPLEHIAGRLFIPLLLWSLLYFAGQTFLWITWRKHHCPR
jgi:hypothetical protein